MAHLLRLIAFLLLLLNVSSVRAATYNFADQGEALVACQSALASMSGYTDGSGGVPDFADSRSRSCGNEGVGTYLYSCGAAIKHPVAGYRGIVGCTARASGVDTYRWTVSTGCSSRNATLGGAERVYVGTPPTCVAGCALTHGGTVSTTVNGVTLNGTGFTEYTGATCTAPAGAAPVEKPGPTTPDRDKACTPLGSGQTACVKPNGNYCASASTGAEICWSPTATGETATANALQQRVPGLSRPSVPPVTPPPEAQSWNPNNSHQTFSPQNGSFTIINYSVVPGDTGNRNIDGSGDASEGDDNEDPGSAGGGGDCAAPPVCSGAADNAAIQCAIVQQSWLERCGASIAENGVACSAESPLVCTNMSQADCYVAAQIKRSQCDLGKLSDAVTGPGDALPDGPIPDIFVEGDGEGDGSEIGDLDSSGWLTNRTCPAIPSVSVFGVTLDIGSHMGMVCGFLDVTSMLVLLFAAFFAARILGET